MPTSISDKISKIKAALRLVTVEPVALFYCIGYGLLPTADNSLMYEKTCLSLYSDSVCDNLHNEQYNYTDAMNEVQRQTSKWQSWQGACESLPFLLTSLLFGSYGDVFGRKIPIVIAILGSMIYACIKMTLAIYMHSSPGFILIGSLIYGASGGLFGLIAGTYGFVASVASLQNRTVRTLLLTVVIQLSEAIGYTLSGIILEKEGYVITYIIGLVCFGAALLWTVVLLSSAKFYQTSDRQISVIENDIQPNTEANVQVNSSHEQQNNSSNYNSSWQNKEESSRVDKPNYGDDSSTINTMGNGSCFGKTCGLWHIKSTIQVLTVKRVNNYRQYINLQILCVFLILFSTEYGIYMGSIHVTRVVAMLLIATPLKRFAGTSETLMFVMGCVSLTTSKFLLGFSVTKWMAFLSEPVIGMMASVPLVCIRSLLSVMVQPSEIGKVMTLVGVVESLGSFCASYFYGYLIYPLTVETFSGAAIVVSGCIMIIALCISIWLHVQLRNFTQYESLQPQNRLEIVW